MSTTQIDAAVFAYLGVYGALPGATREDEAWGSKASAEDAFSAVARAAFPDRFPADAGEMIDHIRSDEALSAEVDRMWEMECEGLEAREIAARTVERIAALEVAS